MKDLITRPLDVVDTLLDETIQKAEDKESLNLIQTVSSHFKELFESNKDLFNQIPSINKTPFHAIQPHSLVRFRCMVQDPTLEKEGYFTRQQLAKKADAKSDSESTKKWIWTMFRENIPAEYGQEWDWVQPSWGFSAGYNSDQTMGVFEEKQPVYCVDVPEETQWVKDHVFKASGNDMTGELANLRISDDNTRPSESDANLMSHKSPLSDAQAAAAIIKLYDTDFANELSLNEVIEVVGVLDYATEPEASANEQESQVVGGNDEAMALFDSLPSPYSVPRIHALFVKRQGKYDNPLAKDVEARVEELESLDIETLREAAIQQLTKILKGDALAAEYIFLHLFSRIHTTVGSSYPVGNLPVNLYSIHPGSPIPESLYTQLQNWVTKCKYQSLSIQELESKRFGSAVMSAVDAYWRHRVEAEKAAQNPQSSEKKEQEQQPEPSTTPVSTIPTLPSGLISGVFQLPRDTNLVIDETHLSPGQLTSMGITNLQHLQYLLQWNKTKYDFHYEDIDMEADVRCLVISEGKSMFLDSNLHIVLPHVASNTTQQVTDKVSMDELNHFVRLVIAVSRVREYIIPEEVSSLIEQEYVETRKQELSSGKDKPTTASATAPATKKETKMNQARLSELLNLARCLALSMGKSVLTEGIWRQTLALETQRFERIKVFEADMANRGRGETPAR